MKAFETTYKVGDLTEGKEYLFGVAAENEVGLSKVMETETFVKAAKPLGKLPCTCSVFPTILRKLDDIVQGWDHRSNLVLFVSLFFSEFLSFFLWNVRMMITFYVHSCLASMVYCLHRKTLRARSPSGSCGSHTQQSYSFLGRQRV